MLSGFVLSYFFFAWSWCHLMAKYMPTPKTMILNGKKMYGNQSHILEYSWL